MITKARVYAVKRSGEIVRVTGWQVVPVGLEGSEKYPYRLERWCRVRYEGERSAGMLVHPDNLTPLS